ncbi:MAG: esterase family protein [Bacteroidales bacterium]|nr:esterase family protein [Bacteroidales bacterium]
MKTTKIFLLLIIGFFLTTLKGTAQESKGHITTERIHSEAIDTTLSFTLYLPSDYDKADQPLPVFYLLHGYVGDHTDWVKQGNIKATMDSLLNVGAIEPMIIAMPDAHNSWYVDSDPEKSYGHYETALIRDLMHYIDTVYSKKQGPKRFIAGLSMGGYGALHLALKYPELFSAAASMSGALWPELPDRFEHFEGTFGVPFNVDKWRKNNPFGLITPDTTKHMPVYITCGDDDHLGFYNGAMEMYKLLQLYDYPSELRITDGGHSWDVWNREVVDILLYFDQLD